MTIHSGEPRSLSFLDRASTMSSSSSTTTTTTTSNAAAVSPTTSRRRSLLLKRTVSAGLVNAFTGVLEGTSAPATATLVAEDPVPRRASTLEKADMLRDFVRNYRELETYKNGTPLPITGSSLTLPAVHFTARYPALASACLDPTSGKFAIDASPATVARIERSRIMLDEKLAQKQSIYGVSTGFGGSADTRTADFSSLGLALLQHQHAGILPTNAASEENEVPSPNVPLPLSDPLPTLSMPAPWVRGALLIRLNSLIRGHSALQFSTLLGMSALLSKDITPLVPLRSSISASGDLSPLSYIAGTLIGEPGILCYSTDPASGRRRIIPAPKALEEHGLQRVALMPKEHLGILNGTAFSCSLSALCVEQAREMLLWGLVSTALGVEAMRGSVGCFTRWVQEVRPHPGQVEAGALLTYLIRDSKLAYGHHAPGDTAASIAEREKASSIDEDAGVLKQDRYPLRTAPQWLGPQIEVLQHAAKTVQIECNSTTDNPLLDPATGIVHNGGNFQAMALTSAMESLRLSLAHVGKLLFAQSTELQNSSMNGGLAGNLAATDPSINFAGKGLDIAQAAYVGELMFLANPVSTGVQSAEMHNQAVNSLAMISARYTLQALDVLQLLTASSLYLLCQALDLRALQNQFEARASEITASLFREHFSEALSASSSSDADSEKLSKDVVQAVYAAYDANTNMDAAPRMAKAAQAAVTPLVSFFLASNSAASLTALPAFEKALAEAHETAHMALTRGFLEGSADEGSEYFLPASKLLGRTRGVYTFVRRELGVRMHGLENLLQFGGGAGLGPDEQGLGRGAGAAPGGRTVGGEVSLIYEALRDGRMSGLLVDVFGEAGVVGWE